MSSSGLARGLTLGLNACARMRIPVISSSGHKRVGFASGKGHIFAPLPMGQEGRLSRGSAHLEKVPLNLKLASLVEVLKKALKPPDAEGYEVERPVSEGESPAHNTQT